MSSASATPMALAKRFRPLYIAAFLQGIIFWFSIEKLFMKSIGFDDQAIAVSIVIFTVVTIVGNMPIGILADRWSRTGVLVLSSLAMAVASLLGGLSNGFWLYVVALCFSGLSIASSSATYDSVVYDTLIEEKIKPSRFNHYYSKLRFYDGIALVAGSLASALIVSLVSVRATYFLTIPFALLSIVALVVFKEPKEHKKEVADALFKHIGATFRAVFRSKHVMLIGLNLMIISIISSVILSFSQLWFIALSLPLILYGPFDALLLSSFSIGGTLSDRMRSKKALLLMSIVSVASAFALLVHQAYVVVFAQAIILIAMVFYEITFERFLHDNLASKVRVGAASVISTVGRVLFLPVALLVGRVSEQNSIFDVSWLIVALLVVLIATSVKVMTTHADK